MPSPRLPLDADEPKLAPGDVLARKYRLEKPLGEGNMAVVWVALNMALETRVAIKILRANLAANPRVVARFRQEAKATAAIAHKNIVQVYDYGVTGWGAPFIVMELLQGETLAQRLKRQGPLAPEEAVRILTRVMKGVSVAHAKGVTHRDLKPENIFLVCEENGIERPKVLDFGVSFVAHRSDDRLTKAGGILGTPSYLPPEVIDGDSRGDTCGDVWALGVILYEILSGELPFHGKTIHALLEAICKTPAPTLLHRVDGVDEDLQKILDRSLAKDPQNRYQGVREFFDELNDWSSRRGLRFSAMHPNAVVAQQRAPSSPHLEQFLDDEDGPTLIGPPIERQPSAPDLPPYQEKTPSSSREMITHATAIHQETTRRRPLLSTPSTATWGWGWLWGGVFLALGIFLATTLRPSTQPQQQASSPEVPPSPQGSVAHVELSMELPTTKPLLLPSSAPISDEVTLDLLGLPEQALVRINGHRINQLPIALKRDQTVLLRVDAPGYEPWLQELVIEGSLKLRYIGKPINLPTRPISSPNYREIPY